MSDESVLPDASDQQQVAIEWNETRFEKLEEKEDGQRISDLIEIA